NWVGGVADPLAALDLMGQGGIPNMGLAQGGVIKSVRFEHVWVEAFVDFEPARGATNSSGNTWVALDASFKQYDYTAGMNLEQHVAFDREAFVAHLTQSATTNTAEGWIQGVDQGYMAQQLADYEARLGNYVTAQNAQATFSDIVGAKTIRSTPLP